MNTRMFRALAAFACCLAAQLRADDWPQYRGPNHDATSSEHILTQWPAGGPKQLWRTRLTDGFSSFAVADGKAFTLVLRDVNGAPQEVCVALDAADGREIWAAPLGVASYDDGGDRGVPGNEGGDGPRSTPSYDSGRVYTLSSRLVLKCFDAATGAPVWTKDLVHAYGARNITWESAASPLIDGNLVFVMGGGAGQSLLAFDKTDGHLVWKTLNERITHSTPVAATILGVRQVIFFTQSGLVSVAPADGALLWRYPFKYAVSTAMSPVVSGDIVYCSAGYGVGSGACRITRAGDHFTATQMWFQPAGVINNHWSTPVCANGFIYGLFGQAEFGSGPLECVDLASGRVLWSVPGFGPGGCTLVDGHVLVLSDAGDLVLVRASPKAYRVVARSHVLSGKCWNSVAISNGRIYARSTKEGVCLDLTPQPVAAR